jgi:hypothetical protein
MRRQMDQVLHEYTGIGQGLLLIRHAMDLRRGCTGEVSGYISIIQEAVGLDEDGAKGRNSPWYCLAPINDEVGDAVGLY